MMSYTKVFKSEAEKQYWCIAEGREQVTYKNWEDILFLIPSKEAMLLNKDAVGSKIVNSFTHVNGGKNLFSKITEKLFFASPSKVTVSIMPGSHIEAAFEDAKNLMSAVNTVYGHFCVLIELNDFLIQRNNRVFEELTKTRKELLAFSEENQKLKTELSGALIKRKPILQPFPEEKQTQEESLAEEMEKKTQTPTEQIDTEPVHEEPKKEIKQIQVEENFVIAGETKIN